jgi:hypothetical protein
MSNQGITTKTRYKRTGTTTAVLHLSNHCKAAAPIEPIVSNWITYDQSE